MPPRVTRTAFLPLRLKGAGDISGLRGRGKGLVAPGSVRANERSAVYHNVLAGHVGRGVGAEEEDEVDEVFRSGDKADRNESVPALFNGLFHVLGEGVEKAGNDAVHVDVVSCPLHGEDSGQLNDARLGDRRT